MKMILIPSAALLASIFLVFFTITTVNAASRLDCNARAEPQKCKNEVDNRCDGKSGDEKDKCIESVLSKYAITGLGAGGVIDCPAGSNAPHCMTTLPKVHDTAGQVRNGLAIVFGVAAGVALIVLLVAAFNYATAGTDIEKAARSKRSIITALIGLVIALSAEAIVLTVLQKI